MAEARPASVQVGTIRMPLPEVIRFGPSVMEHREFALCRVEAIEAKGPLRPHMFGDMHSQVFAGLGYADVPSNGESLEAGVDQFADSLRRPVVRDRLMEALPEEPGFGPWSTPWARAQIVDDPGEIWEMEWPTSEE